MLQHRSVLVFLWIFFSFDSVNFSLGVILDNEMRMTKCNFMQLTHTLTKVQQLGLRKLYKKNCRCIVSSKKYQFCNFIRFFSSVSSDLKQMHSYCRLIFCLEFPVAVSLMFNIYDHFGKI